MKTSPLDKHLLGSTRGQILRLLRGTQCTVDDLARSLDLTGNAVRAHLTALERDGLVQQTGRRRGFAKPSLLYGLAPGVADALFPKPYAAVLGEVLDALDEQVSEAERDRALRTAGRNLAEAQGPVRGGSVRARAEQAAEALNRLGGSARVVEEPDGQTAIMGEDCPLGAIVAGRPEACGVAEAFVEHLVGQPVCEQCDRNSSPPHCCFVLQREE